MVYVVAVLCFNRGGLDARKLVLCVTAVLLLSFRGLGNICPFFRYRIILIDLLDRYILEQILVHYSSIV